MFVDEIEGVAQACGLSFLYGNAAEINRILDLTQKPDFPVLIYFAPVQASDTIESSGLVKTTFPFTAALLKQHMEKTIDYDSSVVQETIDECRTLARQFIHKLNSASFIDDSTPGITSISYPSLYAEYDSHLLGVAIECTIPAKLNSTFC